MISRKEVAHAGIFFPKISKGGGLLILAKNPIFSKKTQRGGLLKLVEFGGKYDFLTKKSVKIKNFPKNHKFSENNNLAKKCHFHSKNTLSSLVTAISAG